MSLVPHHERRQFGRRESALNALAWAPQAQPLQCMVVNFSSNGALLRFFATPVLPMQFRLTIQSRNVDVLAQMRHAQQLDIGVNFISGSIGTLMHDQMQAMAPVAANDDAATTIREMREQLFGTGWAAR